MARRQKTSRRCLPNLVSALTKSVVPRMISVDALTDQVQEIVQELPPKPFADRVINWFFSKLNYIRYPIDERLFRTGQSSSLSSHYLLTGQAYEDVYAKLPSVDPSHCRVLPLVFIVLAMAVRLAPEPWAGDEQHKKLSSLRMYWTCMLGFALLWRH